MFHKPGSVVVTRSDELGRKTVYDVLPGWAAAEGWLPVGRLDRDSRGLLLMVQDRSLVEALGAAGNYRKTYVVTVRGNVTDAHLRRIQQGVTSPAGILRCAEASVLRAAGARTLLRVVLDEGKNRHIRRMFGALKDPLHGTALKVLELKRVGFGPLILDIPSGHWRFLTADEIRALKLFSANAKTRDRQ